MAAAFGLWELRFPSSRAVDEDEDEEDEMTPEKEVELTPSWLWSPKIEEDCGKSSSNVFECSTLVLGVDKVATTFLDAYLLSGGNSEVVGVVSEKHDNKDFSSALKPNTKEKVCIVHRLTQNQDTLVCQCLTHVDENIAFFWTKKLFEQVKPSKVIILTSAPVCEYNTSEPDSLPSDFLKVLHTTEWTKDGRALPCGFVETPNTVRGLAAAILSHSQVFHIPAALYVCYTATRQLDVQAVKTFGVLLESEEFHVLKKSPSEETTKVLKSLGIGRSSYDHLYL
ncbi:hypothetical protein QZH41_010482 [Actinostola sp. cb2023]|nr:hypothetical protein QZH41_010482 [Actinostola sp. cb2023]